MPAIFAKTVDLTLTSVVFELQMCLQKIKWSAYLTLTSVVFEFWRTIHSCPIYLYLTLTSVVFEFMSDLPI